MTWRLKQQRKQKQIGLNNLYFLSSTSVYGIETGVITKQTIPIPHSNYGKSKLQAEELISSLENSDFNIAILSPHIIYGEGCKDSYRALKNLVLKSPFFPNFKNKRSILYIDTLCNFVQSLIDNGSRGLFFPQEKEYICTSETAKDIAQAYGKKIHMTKLFNPSLRILKLHTINKGFG